MSSFFSRVLSFLPFLSKGKKDDELQTETSSEAKDEQENEPQPQLSKTRAKRSFNLFSLTSNGGGGLKEPLPPEKLYTDEFAKNGESLQLPNDLQQDKKISWLEGFTNRYTRIPVKENGLSLTRQMFAGIIKPISLLTLQVEKYQKTRFLKGESAILGQSDITTLESNLTNNKSAKIETGDITNFSYNDIEPQELSIINNLTMTGDIIKGIDKMTIYSPNLETDEERQQRELDEMMGIGNEDDFNEQGELNNPKPKGENTNIILTPNTNESVLNNTPPDEAKGKELVNAEWILNNYGVSPSPYIYNFQTTQTIIPYKYIRKLNYIYIYTRWNINGEGYFCETGDGAYCYNLQCYRSFSKVETKNLKEFVLQACVLGARNGYPVCGKTMLKFYYDIKTGIFRIQEGNLIMNNNEQKTFIVFSKDGLDWRPSN